LRALAVPALAAALAACTPLHHSIEPYASDSGAAGALEAQARASCAAARDAGPLPRYPFTTDGCSLWIDGAWRACCVEHDAAYWCGGSYERRLQADRRMRECVAGLGHSGMADWMFLGVRLGGGSLWPFPWRWGYGWDWPGQ
jgi:hypothetical protein